jgi:hypothetical protein
MCDIVVIETSNGATQMTYFRLSLSHDRTTGRFHHYQVWLANSRTAFLNHVCDLVPGTTREQAYSFIKELAA